MDSCAGICCDGLKSMAFFFADAGFDVWMNNSRGTCFSRQHKYLDPDADKREYWDYSFQEMGIYDQPACFEYILSKVQVPKITYIGHSQGTSQILIALIKNQEFFRSRLNLVILLAPVAHLHCCASKPAQDMAVNENVVKFVNKLGPELLPNPQVDGKITSGLFKMIG